MSELINNTEKRVEKLAEIIKELHAGKDRDEVRRKLASLVRETTSEEIVAMEQKLMSQGMTVDEIKGMCDLHSQVLGELVDDDLRARTTPGHPVHTFQRENEAILGLTKRMRELVGALGAENLDTALARWRELHEQLLEVDKHYARKENVLFPHLERHGITGPSQVMWAKDDDIRVMMKSLRSALTKADASVDAWRGVAEEIAVPMLEQIDEMVKKEEKILLPMALKALTPEEWDAVYRDSLRFGFCLVEPGAGYKPAVEIPAGEAPAGAAIPVGVGHLTQEQLRALVKVLPVDLTFVDADDRVAFFSEGKDRVFGRASSIIGRKVQNCHPPQSVGVVDQILSDFRSGKEDIAEFWINFQGSRFVHIRYFAVRDDAGAYIGTLEVTQDLSRPRALKGERRLLQYDERA